MGRFISVDPVQGGSANAYDYANADPVNGLDLNGMKPYDKKCSPGFIGCKCFLSADFEQLGHHRMRLQWRRACNVASAVSLTGWVVGWGKGDGDGFSAIPTATQCSCAFDGSRGTELQSFRRLPEKPARDVYVLLRTWKGVSV